MQQDGVQGIQRLGQSEQGQNELAVGELQLVRADTMTGGTGGGGDARAHELNVVHEISSRHGRGERLEGIHSSLKNK